MQASDFKMADEEDFESDKKTGKGPLSFFAVVDSSESDSESESEEEEVVKTSGVSKAAESKQLSPVSKLPSPQTLFATVGRPAFLDTAKEQATNIDWNSLSKRYETSFQSQVEYSAPPAPVSLTSVAEDEYDEGVFSSAPVKYKKQPTDIQKHMIVHQKRAADIRVLDLQAPDGQIVFLFYALIYHLIFLNTLALLENFRSESYLILKMFKLGSV